MLRDHIAAISCGVCSGIAVLDLDYAEDSQAETDANFVLTGTRPYRRGTGHRREGAVFRRAIDDLAGAGPQRRDQVDRPAENGGDVSAPAHRRIAGRLVIATHNPGKLAEMRELLAPYKIEAISAGEMGLARTRRNRNELSRQRADQGRGRGDGEPACRPLPTIPAWWSMRSMARPGIYSARWAGPDKNFRGGHGNDRAEASARPAQPRQRNARRISSPRCASPGRTDMSKNSKPASTARSCGRRAATKALATIRFSCRTGTTRTFGEMPSEEKHGLPPRGKGLSHRARAFLKLAEACLG